MHFAFLEHIPSGLLLKTLKKMLDKNPNITKLKSFDYLYSPTQKNTLKLENCLKKTQELSVVV